MEFCCLTQHIFQLCVYGSSRCHGSLLLAACCEWFGIVILVLRALTRASPNMPPMMPPTACFAANVMTAQIGLRLIKMLPMIRPAAPAHSVENEIMLMVLGRGVSKQLL